MIQFKWFGRALHAARLPPRLAWVTADCVVQVTDPISNWYLAQDFETGVHVQIRHPLAEVDAGIASTPISEPSVQGLMKVKHAALHSTGQSPRFPRQCKQDDV